MHNKVVVHIGGDCDSAWIQKLQQLGISCEQGCANLNQHSPGSLEQFIKIKGNTISPALKKELLMRMCIAYCNGCSTVAQKELNKLKGEL